MDKFLSLQLLQEIIISSAFCFGFFLFVLIGGPGALSFFLKKTVQEIQQRFHLE